MSYEFIYFDLDDTLLDHQSAEEAALRDVRDFFSLDVRPQLLVQTYSDVNSELWQQYSQGDLSRDQLQRNRFEQTLRRLDLDASRYKEVGSYYMRCYRRHWQWIDGAQQAYEKTRKKYPVGILTNGFAETQQMKFEQFGLQNSAECTVISEQVGALKPDPKVFEHATELAQVQPGEILYVGDSFRSDIEGGTRFGWKTAWYSGNGDPEKHAKAEFVFNNFYDLLRYLNLHSE